MKTIEKIQKECYEKHNLIDDTSFKDCLRIAYQKGFYDAQQPKVDNSSQTKTLKRSEDESTTTIGKTSELHDAEVGSRLLTDKTEDTRKGCGLTINFVRLSRDGEERISKTCGKDGEYCPDCEKKHQEDALCVKDSMTENEKLEKNIADEFSEEKF